MVHANRFDALRPLVSREFNVVCAMSKMHRPNEPISNAMGLLRVFVVSVVSTSQFKRNAMK